MESQVNYIALRFWVDMLVLVGVIANTIYTWWSNREKVTARRFSALEKQVNARLSIEDYNGKEEKKRAECSLHRSRTDHVGAEIRRIDGELRHLPSQADIGRVHARMDEVHGLVKGLSGELQASRRQLDLVLEELLRRDKR